MAIRIQENVSLRDLTTLKIGGTARYFCSAATVESLSQAVSFAHEKKLPCLILGGGSNVLVSDGVVNAVVIQNNLRGVTWKDGGKNVVVCAGAGENWDRLVEQAVKRNLWGIENLSGIPGTVGAAPIQNIGAYGAEIRDVLEWVEVFDSASGETREMSNEECLFGYRDSIFKHREGKSLIVTRVALRLSANGRPTLTYKDMQDRFAASARNGSTSSSVEPLTLSAIRRAVLEIRSKKFPDLATHGTAGSFFKNPIISKKQFDELKKKYPDLPGFELKVNGQKLMVKLPLAWILDNICQLRGHRRGNVALFERQPIVLVNLGGATAEEIKRFAEEVIRYVKEATGISVEYEVRELA